MAQDRQVQDSIKAANLAAAVQRVPGLVVGTVKKPPQNKTLKIRNVSKQRGQHGDFLE
jgi:uncharacterized phage protein gp47/JayE